MAKDSARNETTDHGCLYGVHTGSKEIVEFPVIKRTPKRVYFKLPHGDSYIDREVLERDGNVHVPGAGWPRPLGNMLYASKPYASKPSRAVAVTRAPAAHTDSARNDDSGAGGLWAELARGDWSSSTAAYATAAVARRIIHDTPMTAAAFAAECKRRNITGWQSQGSVSRRLRWAALHDECWANGILPASVFLSEAATRPLFDGKLTKAERLKLLGELFGPHLSDEQKRQLAAELNEALMHEHLARQGQGGGEYTAPRKLNPGKVIARLLAQGLTADGISEIAHRQEDSARNHNC